MLAVRTCFGDLCLALILLNVAPLLIPQARIPLDLPTDANPLRQPPPRPFLHARTGETGAEDSSKTQAGPGGATERGRETGAVEATLRSRRAQSGQGVQRQRARGAP